MSATATRGALDEKALGELEASFRGEVLRPESPGYDQHRRIWNGSIDRFPAVIARCAGAADVMVYQSGAYTCVSSLTPDHQSFGANGGSGSFSVTAPADCTWKATALPAFVAIRGSAIGSGNGAITYTVAPNSSAAQRSGEIYLSEPGGGDVRRSFYVNQAGGQ